MFDKLLAIRKTRTDNKNDTESCKTDENVFFRAYKDGKEAWKDGIVALRIGKLIYMVQGKRSEHKTHHNQQTKSSSMKDLKHWKKTLKVLYDVFDVPAPHHVTEPRTNS